MFEYNKPDPDALLKRIQEEETKENLGKLKIFFGMSAGVGKTYAMLEESHQRIKEGIEVVVGVINTHGRKETEKMLENLIIVPEKWVNYKDTVFQEFDLDKILEMKPKLVLVDELAHTNVPGSKHAKRWQDVAELLNAGIDVYTTLNVQHLESRKEIIEQITNISIRETVPDLILERATTIELIDLPPSELLKRLSEGKVYLGEQSQLAAQNFFKEDNLTALREIALRITAEKVEHDLHGMMVGIRSWHTRERLMVGITSAPSSALLLRSARRLAFELDAPWVAVYVDSGQILKSDDQIRLNKNLQLAQELGAEVVITHDLDVANSLQRIAAQKDITRLVIGRSEHHHFGKCFYKSLIDRLEEENKQMDILILRQDKLTSLYQKTIHYNQSYSPIFSYLVAIAAIVFTSVIGYILIPFIGYKSVGFVFLITILILGLFVVGRGPIFIASLMSALSWYLLITPSPMHFKQSAPEDIALIPIYFFTAIIVGMITNRLRKQDIFLYRREEKVEHLYEIMQEIAKSTNFQGLRTNVSNKLKQLFNGEFDILIKGSDNRLIFDSNLPILTQEKERAAAIWCFQNGKMAGWSTDTLPSSEVIYFAIKFLNRPIGVLVFHSKDKKPFSIDEINFLQTVIQQLGLYLEHSINIQQNQQVDYTRQVEKLHSAIFHSLSRNFYTPLEKMLISTQKLRYLMHSYDEKQLSAEIANEGNKLKIIIDNILTISQLESGFVRMDKKRHSIKYLIDLCIENIKQFITEHPIHIHVPESLHLFEFDLYLIEIALRNIILNAIEYSDIGKSISIVVKVDESKWLISVIDEGVGIPKEILPFIFDKFWRAPDSTAEGIGLGLTIVKAVVDLHQGTIEVETEEGKGTKLSLILPI